MLYRIEALEEIGRFASLKQKAPHFARLTLVYARNGYGKSTLCAVLRSATDSDPSHINARKRLGAKGDCRVHSKWASGIDAIFAKGEWSICPGQIFIFDQEFVRRNLHVGDDVTRDNKRSLLPVVLGAQGVALSQKVIDLDREQRELDSVMKANSTLICTKLPIITAKEVSAFCAKEVPGDIDEKVEKAGKTFELAKNATAVKQKEHPKKIVLASLEHFREIAERSIADASESSAEQVRLHIEKHHLAPPQGERWLKYGLDHTKDICPYCDQSTKNLTLIEAFKAYFSDAFAKLVKDRDEAVEAAKVLRSNIGALLKDNVTDFEFWKGVCKLPKLPMLDGADRQSVEAGLDFLLSVLAKKVANPLAVANFGSEEENIKGAFALIDSYNAVLDQCISVIDAAKAEVATVDLQRATEARDKWLALKAKQSEPIDSAVTAYQAAETRRGDTIKEKELAQAELKAYALTATGAKQKEINELLSDFGANFTIVDTKANFVGREPNTEYAIAIGPNKIQAGEHSDNEPSFKTVLSAGDKTTLALAFFIAQVKADPQLANAIVVFDDPFSSQDIHRQFETTSQIREVGGTACQTIVLSHDPRFLDTIERNANPAMIGSFQLLCADNGEGSITTWSAADEIKDLYVKRAEAIQEYAGRGKLLPENTEIMLIQAMRPFLEDYLRARYPGRFAENDMLFDMADAVKKAGQDDPLFASVPDLLSINEYTRKDHHGGGTQPDPTELRAHCKKIGRIIGAY